jgi:hypothetical protein
MSGLLCPAQGSNEADSNFDAKAPVMVEEIGLYNGDPEVNMAMVDAGVVPKEDPFVGFNGTAMYCHLTPTHMSNRTIVIYLMKPFYYNNLNVNLSCGVNCYLKIGKIFLML